MHVIVEAPTTRDMSSGQCGYMFRVDDLCNKSDTVVLARVVIISKYFRCVKIMSDYWTFYNN